MLAVRICGLALIAAGLHFFASTLGVALSLLNAARHSGEGMRHGLLLLLQPGLDVGVGAVLALLAPRIAALAANPAQDGETARVGEPIRLGVLLIGLVIASSLLAALLLLPLALAAGAPPTLNLWVPAGAAVMLLAWPRPVVGLMQRRTAAGASRSRTGGLVAAGLAVAGLWFGIRALTRVTFDSAMLVHPQNDYQTALAAQSLAVAVVRLALAAAIFQWCGAIAGRLSHQAHDSPPPASPLPGGLCVCIAVFLIGFQETILPLARGAFGMLPTGLSDLPPTAHFAALTLIKAALIVAAAWLIRALGPWLGRRFYPEEAPADEAESRALVILQVGLILMALYAAVRGTGWRKRPPEA